MDTVARPRSSAERGVVLANRRLARRLAVHGFAKVRVVEADVAAALRQEYLDLRPDGGHGFDPDLNNPDSDYRQAVSTLLRGRLGPAVGDVFVEHEPFLWNFICKWPHDDETLYNHRDWMFVDERAGARSYSVWIALQDTVGHNGQLRVLPGSHRVAAALSGTDLSPSWIEGEAVADRLVSVPVRAGEAVVLDHALVHGSYGNHTDEPRVAVGCALRGSGEPLVHFRAVDDDTAVRYDVDESFFVNYTPAALMAAPPDLVPAESVPITPGAGPAIDEVTRGLDAELSLRHRVVARARRDWRRPIPPVR